jgi:hypothetical protein
MAEASKNVELMAEIRPLFFIRRTPFEASEFTKAERIQHLPPTKAFAIDFLTCA